LILDTFFRRYPRYLPSLDARIKFLAKLIGKIISNLETLKEKRFSCSLLIRTERNLQLGTTILSCRLIASSRHSTKAKRTFKYRKYAKRKRKKRKKSTLATATKILRKRANLM
jgi:hypothetical protein